MGDISILNRSRIYNYGIRKKPAELFRKDLISAMKMADSEQLHRNDYLPITEPWREEWEKGVQVPVNPDILPQSRYGEANTALFKETDVNSTSDAVFKMPKKLLKVCRPICNRKYSKLNICFVLFSLILKEMQQHQSTKSI